ncbi:MAG: hypothetical protein J6K29_10295 [Clostridia bacterium]|nr:hypothetical protein [Clostridia bacterium]
MTQAAIDAVFADERYRRKFTSPRRDKAICEERMAGMMWKDIARKHKKSEYYCREVTRRAKRLYEVFIA